MFVYLACKVYIFLLPETKSESESADCEKLTPKKCSLTRLRKQYKLLLYCPKTDQRPLSTFLFCFICFVWNIVYPKNVVELHQTNQLPVAVVGMFRGQLDVVTQE